MAEMSHLRFLLALGVLTITAGSFMSENCRVFLAGKVDNYDVDEACMNGKVEWHNPRSTVRINFRHPQPKFKVCFTDYIGGDVFGLVDVSDGRGRIFRFERGSSREECIRSVKGKATLEMRVNDTTVYMGAIEYSVVMLHS